MAQRGRSGGLGLARPAQEIGVGTIVRHMETDFDLVECMRSGGDCTITAACRLIAPLAEARAAFLTTLDAYTIADIAISPRDFGLAAS
ncbi:Rrf2 family transcriptional regulator [Thioclava nitratireducens]|uniref:Rrf2 family transcriptional regulator n=1 Tax=Thioclava nitratireducens TaxID=1915078 RepID=UPI001FCAC635|nr:Rrf2 family transcriptional regulator [Thioclava nitratireducens]